MMTMIWRCWWRYFVDEDKQEAAAEKEALQPSEDGEADDKLDIEEVE